MIRLQITNSPKYALIIKTKLGPRSEREIASLQHIATHATAECVHIIMNANALKRRWCILYNGGCASGVTKRIN